jgi:hypothetical protein
MKYKKQIATGVLAFSLLISGTNVFAATPQDLGIKNSQQSPKQNKNVKTKKTGRNNIVGTISSITSSGFMVDIKNIKTKTTSSVDVITTSTTTYSKNGVSAKVSDLLVGQKVIVVGTLDKTTNIITAKTIKIAS